MVDSLDRRKAARCPVCQGPGYTFEANPDDVRCRNSLCMQNHGSKKCPRCGSESVGAVRRNKDNSSDDLAGDSSFAYTCADCEHVWH